MPLTYARTTIIKGEQGSGKTNTLAGFIVDRYFDELCGIESPEGKKYAAKPFIGEDGGVYRDRVIVGGDGKERVIALPDNWTPLTRLKTFTNFHLYGLKYVYCTVRDMLKWMNEGIIKDGILGTDESYIFANARRPTASEVVMFTDFLNQVRKRHLDLYMLFQHSRFGDWKTRWQANKEITCRYDERTQRVHLIIKDVRRNKEKTTSYWAPQYWRYYDTDEIPDMPQKRIDKVLEKV